MTKKVVTLDVRAMIREGCDPFRRIMQAVAALRPNQGLRVIAPFKPVPLLAILGERGFGHTAVERAPGNWEVHFQRAASPKADRG